MSQLALDKITYGLYVTGVQDTNWYGGNIIDAFMQTTMVPPTIMYSAMNKNRTTEIILEKGEFTVSALPADVHPFYIANFGFQSSRKVDKWANVPYEVVDGLPVLKDAAAYFRLKVIDSRNLQTHTLFYCEVVDAWPGEKDPLIYADYRKSMKPLAMSSFLEFQKTQKSPVL
jgi:flavin reductase (DIM6/NTAB) family NADH-FMN oxidoreductase RutF